MAESRDYLEMTFRSIQCFANDGRLDAQELDKILMIAERDGVIDTNEKRVLENIMAKVKPHELNEALRVKFDEVNRKITS